MTDLDNVRPQAVAALAKLSDLLSERADETKELREAGVAVHTIDRLYPFDLADWLSRIHVLAGADEAYDAWRFLVPSHSTLDQVARCLPRQTLPEASTTLAKLESGTAYESTAAALAARFELTVVVLEMIKRAEALEPSYGHMFPNRSNQFFAEVDQLLKVLGGKAEVSLPF